MNILIILFILIIHWLADFVLQTPWQAENKSKSLYALLSHTFSYSLVWLIIGLIYFICFNQQFYSREQIMLAFYFSGITFICHTITDFFTSKINAILWEKKRVHDFFVSVGFDQFLHYAQLLLTYYYLIK